MPTASARSRPPSAQPGDDLEALYRKMVDENLVRKDISFAEMAMLALDYAADPGTAVNDPEKAVAVLFKSAGYQKRSYIRTFMAGGRTPGRGPALPAGHPARAWPGAGPQAGRGRRPCRR